MKRAFAIIIRSALSVLIVGAFYLLSLFYPQPYFGNKVSVGNITVYSDEKLPEKETANIIRSVTGKLEKSSIYLPRMKQNVFIVNNPVAWKYFTNRLYKVGGLNYVPFNHNVFLRKSDIPDNRLYGPSGKKVGDYRTLDYFITHEITHSLEFLSMPWYTYPIQTNWVLEGYCEHIAHGSMTYQEGLDRYMLYPENKGSKYYTKVRTMVAYLLEKEHVHPKNLWSMANREQEVLKKAIPNDKPLISDY